MVLALTRIPRLWRLLLLSALLALLVACQQRVVPPSDLSDPAIVYITDYGRHAGLALPSGEDRLTEWFWGDWHYYALRDRSFGSGLRALFASPRSALGRLDIPGTDAAAVRSATGAPEVLAAAVERSAAADLHDELSRRFALRRDTEIGHANGERFVEDDEHYSLFRNSNHQVCDWLRSMGARVHCPGIGADFVLVDSEQ
ncbi:MAG: DUF2459 domain-containing protein [Parasphingopyxis sp.]|nr:DUF2459 domain-containing protein [Sphingomonadales bacterium]